MFCHLFILGWRISISVGLDKVSNIFIHILAGSIKYVALKGWGCPGKCFEALHRGRGVLAIVNIRLIALVALPMLGYMRNLPCISEVCNCERKKNLVKNRCMHNRWGRSFSKRT